MTLPILDRTGHVSDANLIHISGAFRIEVDPETRIAFSEMLNAGRHFHRLPYASKQYFDMRRSGSCRGYYPSSADERQFQGSNPSSVEEHLRGLEHGVVVGRTYETLDVGPQRTKVSGGTAKSLFEGFEELPRVSGLAISYKSFLVALNKLGPRIEACLEELGALPAGYYSERSSDPCSQLRLLRYPAAASGGLNPHTDYEAYTVCAEDRGGLQVSIDGEWVSAECGPLELVVLAGDLTEIATNGRLPAARHRVELEGGERHSLSFFSGFDYYRRVIPMGTRGERARVGLGPRGVVAGHHLAGLTVRNYSHLLDRVRTGKLVVDFPIPGANPLDAKVVPLFEPADLPHW